jgi:Alr-MurF fusion protein
MISLYDILEASNGQLFGEPAAHIFTDFCFDSRHASDAQLYVALKTDRGDTHQFMREAVEKGVLGILCVHPPDFDTEGISVVIVKDAEVALMAWAHYVLDKLGTQVVCVAGSSGKSLAMEAISRVLGTRYTVHHNPEAEGRLGLPRSLAGLSPEQQFLVLELGAEHPGELGEIVDAVQPDVGVLLNFGQTHLDAFASLDEIVNEHRLLLEKLPMTGLAVLNSDDDHVASLTGVSKARVLTVGMERFGADLMAYNVLAGLTKTGYDLRYGSERYLGRWTPWLGKHQLYAVLSALAVGIHYDVPLDEAIRALTDMPYLPGRMTPLNGLNNSMLIDDTYDATPQSNLAVMDWFQAVNAERAPESRHRLFYIVGDMDYLGDYTQIGHRLVGQRAAEVADVIITEGTDAALVGRAALDRGKERGTVFMTYSVQDAVAVLRENFELTSNDTIVVTGGISARMELVVQALLQDEADRALLPRQGYEWETAELVQPNRPSWIEVDLEALAYNVKAVKTLVGSVALMSVVKADAYGHGAVSVSRTALLNGAEYLAVGSMTEALELTEAGIDAPILVLNYTPISAVRQAIRQRITLTVYDLDMARAYDRAARELGGKLLVHVKVDTGMGRLGVLAAEALPFFRHLFNLKHLEIEGIYTHFASADEDPDFTAQQVKTFKDILKPLRASGFNFAYTHAANSAGTLASKDNHFNMVRVGLAMYGLSPSQLVPVPPEFRPVLSWKTVVAQVKTLPRGHTVGYGRTYVTSAEERIAVIPVGFADGFRRSPNNWGEVLVHGQRAPIVGRVSMEKTTINVSHIPDVTIGDEVVLLGRQGDDEITVDQVAERLGTNSYEVVTSILPRAARR